MENLNQWITPALLLGVLVFLWNLHRDIAELRERMAKLEGLFKGFIRLPVSPHRGADGLMP